MAEANQSAPKIMELNSIDAFEELEPFEQDSTWSDESKLISEAPNEPVERTDDSLTTKPRAKYFPNGKSAWLEFPAKPGKPAYEINPTALFGIDWDYKHEALTMTFTVEVPVGMWFAIGYAWHMFDVDMFLMQAYPDIRRSMVSDLWSTHNVTPLFDELDNFYDIQIKSVKEGKMQEFTFKRLLDTGDEERDFMVQLDKDLHVCFGINAKTPDFIANTDWGLFKMRYNSDGVVEVSGISTGHSRFVIHGSVMFFCWFFLGFLLLGTKRYFQWNWLAMHIAHLIMGTIVFVVTCFMGYKVISQFEFHVHPDYHQILGCITLVVMFVGSVLGIVTAYLMAYYRGDKPWTDCDKARRVAIYHRYFGYFMLMIANVTCMAGVLNYVQKQIKQDQYSWYIVFTLPLFLLIVIAFETRYRLTSQEGVLSFDDVKPKQKMTIQEFHSWVLSGKNLVIIDDLVLDLGRFSMIHPGGKFALQRTVGRDISKFFYGGFHILSEEGSQAPHLHSLKALETAKKMVVARLESKIEDKTVTVTRIAKKIKDNPSTCTFCFETIDLQPVEKFSKMFTDLSNYGKHFLLSASSEPKTIRQYTICNCLEPELQVELFKLMDSVLKKTRFAFNKQLIQDSSSNRCFLTIKNYKKQVGLSTKVHAQKVNEGVNQHNVDFKDSGEEDNRTSQQYKAHQPMIRNAETMKKRDKKYLIQSETFNIKGPFGKGLDIRPTGVHVAFAAGTGVLVFLDLVTRILLHNTGVKSLGEAFDDDFKFVFFISHQNLNETMGMDLCLKLMEVNKVLKIDNFQLIVRLSEGKDGLYGKPQEKWATDLIREQLIPMAGKLAKIYVCGPPIMNQTFDISLEQLSEELKIARDQIEIM